MNIDTDNTDEIKPQKPKKKNKKEKVITDMSSSLLIPGGLEICAAPKPARPSTNPAERHGRVAEQTGTGAVAPGRRTTVEIEMERLEKLIPRKNKKYRGRRNNRRQSTDPILPEGGSLGLARRLDGEAVQEEQDPEAESTAVTVEKRDRECDSAESRQRASSNPYISSHSDFIRELKEKFLQIVATDSDKDCESRDENVESTSRNKTNFGKADDADIPNSETIVKAKYRSEIEPINEISPRSSCYNDSGVFDSGPACTHPNH